MFSRDPSELTRKTKFDREETARAIRLSIAAELDAINFYLQQSNLYQTVHFERFTMTLHREGIIHLK